MSFGQWWPLDPSVESLRRHARTKKSGGFGQVGSDRIVVSHGCDLKLTVGDLSVEAPILQHPTVVSKQASRLTTTLDVQTVRL